MNLDGAVWSLRLWDFDRGSAALKSEHTMAIGDLTANMSINGIGASAIQNVDGWASPEGAAEENAELSLRRADEVAGQMSVDLMRCSTTTGPDGGETMECPMDLIMRPVRGRGEAPCADGTDTDWPYYRAVDVGVRVRSDEQAREREPEVIDQTEQAVQQWLDGTDWSGFVYQTWDNLVIQGGMMGMVRAGMNQAAPTAGAGLADTATCGIAAAAGVLGSESAQQGAANCIPGFTSEAAQYDEITRYVDTHLIGDMTSILTREVQEQLAEQGQLGELAPRYVELVRQRVTAEATEYFRQRQAQRQGRDTRTVGIGYWDPDSGQVLGADGQPLY